MFAKNTTASWQTNNLGLRGIRLTTAEINKKGASAANTKLMAMAATPA